ncbi:TSCPD domain-containing protein [Hominenteromicrobium sp.]
MAALAVGMTVDEYVKRCKGIKCGFKNTSCPDQLALALEEALAEQKKA